MTQELNENATKREVRGRQAHFSRRLSPISLSIYRTASSGGQIVSMMESAQPWHRDNFAVGIRIFRSLTAGGRFLRQREMGAVLMVIADVLSHEALQMALVENDHVVEQVPAAVADPTVGNAVLPRTAETGPLGLNAETLHCVDHVAIELCAAIKDQVTGRRVVRECLAQLLNHPNAGRMSGHVEMQDAPPIMRYDKETVQYAEGQRRHGEEVHRGNRFSVIAQEGRPSFCRFRAPRRSPHPAQHRSLGNIETQHLEFAMNPRRTPGWVLGDHAEDKFTQLPADAFSSPAGPMPREPRPVQLESRPVPTNDGLWLDKGQHPLPSGPEPPQHHPEQLVRNCKSRLWVPLLQDAELLPECQVFQEQVAARTGRSNEPDEQEPERARHVPVVAKARERPVVRRIIADEKLSRVVGCSRICNGQSTQKPQGSTRISRSALSDSIKSTYSNTISTGFHKRSDLFWEQRVGGSNPSAPTIESTT